MKKIILFLISLAVLSGCNNKSDNAHDVQKSQQITIDSIKAVNIKQKTIDSMKERNRIHVERTPQNSAITTTPVTPVTTTSTTTKKKKGWSNTAKGAVIGAGVGAVTGAIIDKKHPGQGAVIGGAI